LRFGVFHMIRKSQERHPAPSVSLVIIKTFFSIVGLVRPQKAVGFHTAAGMATFSRVPFLGVTLVVGIFLAPKSEKFLVSHSKVPVCFPLYS